MYPVLFRIGDFEITSFGVLVAIGALVGIWLFNRELARGGLPSDATDAAVAGVVGGLLGAKLLWTLEFAHEAPFAALLFSRGGLSWFGGFIGGVGTGLWMLRRRHVPVMQALSAATPGLAAGQAIGRIGCFMVGDDYGRPSSLPWAMAFPEGRPPTSVPVHPTQVYEAIALAGIAWALIRWRRDGVADSVVFGRYLLFAGLTRFAIEFIRVNVRIVGPLTVAQLMSLSAVAVGCLLSPAFRKGSLNSRDNLLCSTLRIGADAAVDHPAVDGPQRPLSSGRQHVGSVAAASEIGLAHVGELAGSAFDSLRVSLSDSGYPRSCLSINTIAMARVAMPSRLRK